MFPTTTGISEDEARGICQTGLSKATLYTRCHDEPGMNLTALVDSCMEDFKVDVPYIVTQPFSLKKSILYGTIYFKLEFLKFNFNGPGNFKQVSLKLIKN